MEYLVTSGSDRIFSSKDCQAESSDLVKTIRPGPERDGELPVAAQPHGPGLRRRRRPNPRGGTYVFTARLGNKTSPKAVFQLG